jgi:hypothetical protein
MVKDYMEWHIAANKYLARLGQDEWKAQGSPIPTKRNKQNRFAPSEYMLSLIDCLNRNDEKAFKALKMLSGYNSASGV